MGKKSQSNGKNFETKLCWYLSDHNYFVIYNEKGISGSQPCDIIAIRNDEAILIEAKNLDSANGIFPLNRIEQNQIFAHRRYKQNGNYNFILTINWNSAVYTINFDSINFDEKSIDLKKLEPCWIWED